MEKATLTTLSDEALALAARRTRETRYGLGRPRGRPPAPSDTNEDRRVFHLDENPRENPDLQPVQEERERNHHPTREIMIEPVRHIPRRGHVQDASQGDPRDVRDQGNRDRTQN